MSSIMLNRKVKQWAMCNLYSFKFYVHGLGFNDFISFNFKTTLVFELRFALHTGTHVGNLWNLKIQLHNNLVGHCEENVMQPSSTTFSDWNSR